MRAITAMMMAMSVIGVAASGAPARADEDGRGHGGWRRHERHWGERRGGEHGWGERRWGGYAPPPFAYAPPAYYVAPRYYAPPPAYYAPPPPYYAPPVYAAPGVSFGFSFR